MPDNPKDITEVIIFATDPDGEALIVHYGKDFTEYVPYLSTGLTKVNEYFNSAREYIPSKGSVWNYVKSWVVAKKAEEELGMMIQVPKWAVGNFTQALQFVGSTYKSITGAVGGLYSLDKAVKAFQCKDPICLSLSGVALVLDLLKIGSNIFPYHHNCTKNDAINYCLKATTKACEEFQVCDKIKKVVAFVRSDKVRGRVKKLWGVIKNIRK